MARKEKRALFEARGEIFTIPAEKGDVRNLTSASGSAEIAPLWSPASAQSAGRPRRQLGLRCSCRPSTPPGARLNPCSR